METALAVSRERYKPSRQLATSQEMSFTDMLRSARRLTQPPIDDIDAYCTDGRWCTRLDAVV